MVVVKFRNTISKASKGLIFQPPFFLGARGSAPQISHRPQNWVLDPLQDFLFIIAAPLLCLGLALLAMQHFGAVQGAAMVIVAHVVMTVAHHMPTFIRIYGDVDLLRRFKWNILLGPVVPLCFSAAVLAYINYHRYPVEYFLYLYIFLSLWDPWHFLRQHFGFMRIYDRNNEAPKQLASNLDWAICVIWFVHIMVASADWIPGLLEDLYRNASIPLLLFLPSSFIDSLQSVTWWLAALITLVYGIYLVWCWQRGYFISMAKLALLVCTFGVMYFTYTPNEWILQLAPAWGFKVGFATVGIVHMTQYLAVVWRYDRKITQQGRARKDWFNWLHSRKSRLGVVLAASTYVALCIGYGDLITTTFENRWIMSVLLAIGFTSTLLHYYYDGFIWKMRHAQNRQALGLEDQALEWEGKQSESSTAKTSADGNRAGTKLKNSVSSWWSNAIELTAGKMLLRQLLYFGVPMGILTIGALNVWSSDNVSYIQHMYRAQAFSEQGQSGKAREEAHLAFAGMQKELPVSEKLAELRPSSSNEAALAFLVYNESLYHNLVMPSLSGENPTLTQQRNHAAQTQRAANLLMSAVYRGGDLAHPGREQLTRQQARAIASSWKRQ